MSLVCCRIFERIKWIIFEKMTPKRARQKYRFSAFWLRSKCSICSYQLNLWYKSYLGFVEIYWFLGPWRVVRACSPPAAGRPGIAPTSGIGPDPIGGSKFTKNLAKKLTSHSQKIRLVNNANEQIYFNITYKNTVYFFNKF